MSSLAMLVANTRVVADADVAADFVAAADVAADFVAAADFVFVLLLLLWLLPSEAFANISRAAAAIECCAAYCHSY